MTGGFEVCNDDGTMRHQFGGKSPDIDAMVRGMAAVMGSCGAPAPRAGTDLRFVRSCALGAALALTMLGCADPTAPYGPADSVGNVHVAFGSEPGDWAADPLQIDSARVEESMLNVYVSHGGGCGVHEYAAIAWNGWLESYPVQVGTLIAHRANGDQCRALLYRRLRFDLTPLRQAYVGGNHPASATIIIRLHTNSRDPGDSILVTYSF